MDFSGCFVVDRLVAESMVGLIRLGFAVSVHGSPNLPSADVRPSARGPELSVGLAYLRDVLLYARANGIGMYRMHSRLVPVFSGDSWRDVAQRLGECQAQLRLIGELVAESGMRVSFHPDSTVTLNALNEDHLARAGLYLRTYAAFLDAMGSVDGVVVCHVGGIYGDKQRAAERFEQQYGLLDASVRSRVVLEHDDRCFSFADVWAIHNRTGVPVVFDNLHHHVLNPERVPVVEALRGAIGTWGDARPKLHFCTARSEMRSQGARIKVPTWTEHSDYANPFEFAAFADMMPEAAQVDVMLEARACDLAALKLRQDLARYSPELATRVH